MQRTNTVLLSARLVASTRIQAYRNVQKDDDTRHLSSTLNCVAESLMVVGRPEFYNVLATMLCTLFECNRYLIMRYSRSDKPAFLLNRSFPQATAQLYGKTLYENDPIYQMVRNGRAGGVMSLHSTDGESRLCNYRDALSKHARSSRHHESECGCR